jgi:hypothetical protein
MGLMPTLYDVFLSHNSKDKPAVRELAMALRGRGFKVWLDEWELVPGRPWLDALEEVIESIACAAVLVGKDGLGPWELPEIRACLNEFVRRRLPVIPVLLPGAPDRPTLPLLLRQFTWVDLRSGLTTEDLDRLQWGITGVKPERQVEPVAPRLSATSRTKAEAELAESKMKTSQPPPLAGAGTLIGPRPGAIPRRPRDNDFGESLFELELRED